MLDQNFISKHRPPEHSVEALLRKIQDLQARLESARRDVEALTEHIHALKREKA